MADTQYDLAIIGAGPGGYVAAIRAAQLGLKPLLIERENLGGICLNWGCIPTKAMMRSAEVFHLMERASEFGLKNAKPGFDFEKIIARSRRIAGQLSSGVAHLMKKNKITVLMGEAALKDSTHIRVATEDGEKTVSAKNIIIATGARARELPNLEIDGEVVWNYRHALTPKRMPQKLLVVGSGAIGVEFASFYSTLGAEVTLIEAADRIVPNEDEDISRFAHKKFADEGMNIMTSAKLVSLAREKKGAKAQIETSDGTKEFAFDTVISAVGIAANVEGLGLEALGISLERGHIKTDALGHTGVGGIYAIGDVTEGPWLAHKASHEGVIVAEAIAGKAPHPLNRDAIAGCTYCRPQIASVGLTEGEARARGLSYKTGTFPFLGNGKAIALGEAEGFVKTIFDAESGALLGAHMIGAEVTELIQGFVIGQKLETTEAEFFETIFPHPTLSEMMHESALDAFDRVLHF